MENLVMFGAACLLLIILLSIGILACAAACLLFVKSIDRASRQMAWPASVFLAIGLLGLYGFTRLAWMFFSNLGN